MIDSHHITEHGRVVLWSERVQVALDLIIDRAIIVIFSDDFLQLLRSRS